MKKILLFALSIMLLGLLGSHAVFAEDDTECTGRIKGETIIDPLEANFNGGVTTFNDAGDLKLVDLSVMLGAGSMGYAPSREAAACTISDEDEAFMTLGPDEFGVKGFAWNTNLGFISMYCDGAAAPYENLGFNCGNFQYGVKVGAEATSGAPAGKRPLLGYAYNDVVGYINFSCNAGKDVYGNACGGVNYGVFRDSAGNLEGHAYTTAGIYLVFTGVNMGLPDELVVEDGWCDGKPFVCLEIKPDPLSLDYNLTDGYKLADGKDYYEVHVYLKDKNGVYDPALYDEDAFFESLNFSWVDRLKLNQLAGQKVEDSLNEKAEPYRDGKGGVVYKPVSGLTIDDFTHDEKGHFVLKYKISSFAPSSDGNVSKTSSLTPPILVKNERFLYQYPKIGQPIEENVLKLMNLSFTLLDSKGDSIPGVPGVVYPNGQDGLALKFKPVWDLTTLYVNNLQDKIVGYRGIPVSFTLKATLSGKEPFVNPSVDFLLDYDKNKTDTSPLCLGKPAMFDFHFLKDVEGKELECLELSDPTDPSSPCLKYQGDLLKQSLMSLMDRQILLPAVATVFVEDDAVPCDMVQGPGFISVISYQTSDGLTVSYYGNKIPRLGGGVISNPAALIRGNVYAQTSFTPSAQTESGQVLSTVNLDIVQDTVKENLAKAFLNKKLPVGSGRACVLKGLSGEKDVSGCTPASDFAVFDVKDEKAFYFKDSDVVVDSNISWDGLKVLIVDGGNVYINENLYNEVSANKRLSLVVLRGYDKAYGEAGNIYIAPNVQNIQANIAASGSIFSYSGDREKINRISGEPIWVSDDARIEALNRQIFIQGSISSRNTIGGADLDAPRSGSLAKAKPYLLLGTGEILQNPTGEDRIRAQLYDLNYLRLFRMEIETSPEGLPVDQQCGKGLTPDDIMQITLNQNDPTNNPALFFNGNKCNGIDPLSAYPPGDLVAPDDLSLYAQGVPEGEQNSPVYIFYVAPSKDSFVFSKPGALNIGR